MHATCLPGVYMYRYSTYVCSCHCYAGRLHYKRAFFGCCTETRRLEHLAIVLCFFVWLYGLNSTLVPHFAWHQMNFDPAGQSLGTMQIVLYNLFVAVGSNIFWLAAEGISVSSLCHFTNFAV